MVSGFSFKKLSSMIRAWRDRFARNILGDRAINPNYITLLSLISSVAAAYLLCQGYLTLAWLAILLAVFLDLLDGFAARSSKLKPRQSYGETIDYTFDRLSEASIKAGLIYGGLCNVTLAFLSLFSNLFANLLVVEGERNKLDLRYTTVFPSRALILVVLLPIAYSGGYVYLVDYALVLEVVAASLMSLYAITVFLSANSR